MQTTITRRQRAHGSLQPAVLSTLAGLPDQALNHLAHNLRPPVGIYNLSMGRVLRAFTATLDELDLAASAPWTDKGVKFDPAKLLATQTELLEAMLSHIDDGYQILRACHPPQPGVEEPFADTWLAKARHPSVAFFKHSVEPYRTDIAAIVNKVKHEHGQLRCVAFTDGHIQTAGYYLEGVDADGVAIPDPRVHPNDTAFSFDRDLRLHFVQLFEIGSALKGALTKALRLQKIRPSETTFKGRPDEFRAVAERVANLPQLVFPDEVAKPTPGVSISRNDDDVQLTVTYPSLSKLVAATTMQLNTFITLDGGTLSFRIPYAATKSG
jgi:hypothetical protein